MLRAVIAVIRKEKEQISYSPACPPYFSSASSFSLSLSKTLPLLSLSLLFYFPFQRRLQPQFSLLPILKKKLSPLLLSNLPLDFNVASLTKARLSLSLMSLFSPLPSNRAEGKLPFSYPFTSFFLQIDLQVCQNNMRKPSLFSVLTAWSLYLFSAAGVSLSLSLCAGFSLLLRHWTVREKIIPSTKRCRVLGKEWIHGLGCVLGLNWTCSTIYLNQVQKGAGFKWSRLGFMVLFLKTWLKF